MADGERQQQQQQLRTMWLPLRTLLVLCLWSSCLYYVRSSISNSNSVGQQLRLLSKKSADVVVGVIVEEGEEEDSVEEKVEALPRPGASTREREIAAIFRGVAYGAPTTTTTTTTTITTTTKKPINSLTTMISSNPISSVLPSQDLPTTTVKGNFSHQQGRTELRTTHVEYNTPLDTHQFDLVVPGRDTGGSTASSMPPNIVVRGGTNRSVVSSTGKEREFGGLNNKVPNPQLAMGVAWWAQVWVWSGLYTLVAIFSLCLMGRAGSSTGLLPRPHYLTLHALLVAFGLSRSFYLLQEAVHYFTHPYFPLLPPQVLTALQESGWPILTSGLTTVLMGVVMRWHQPARPHVALILALITVVHLAFLPTTHLIVAFLHPQVFPVVLTSQALALTWGGTVGVGGIWAVWAAWGGIHSSRLTGMSIGIPGDVPNMSQQQPTAKHLVLAVAVTQLLLAGVNLFLLVAPITPRSPQWLWWCAFTIPQGLELIMAGTLLTAAAHTHSRAAHCCTMFGYSSCHCCQKRTVEIIHPSGVKMIHPLGVYTVQGGGGGVETTSGPKNTHAHTLAALALTNNHKGRRDHKSLDYVTSDFQLVWSHVRPLTTSNTTSRLQDQTDLLQLRVDNNRQDPSNATHVFPLASGGGAGKPFLKAEVVACPLPSYTLYATVPGETCPLQEDSKMWQENISHTSRRSSTLLSGSSGDGTSSRLYSSPQPPLRACRSWDELSSSHIYEEPHSRVLCSSVDEALSDLSDLTDFPSDLTTDYLTDFFCSDAGSSPVLLCPTNQPQKKQKHHSRRRRHLTTGQMSGAKQFVVSNQQLQHESVVVTSVMTRSLQIPATTTTSITSSTTADPPYAIPQPSTIHYQYIQQPVTTSSTTTTTNSAIIITPHHASEPLTPITAHPSSSDNQHHSSQPQITTNITTISHHAISQPHHYSQPSINTTISNHHTSQQPISSTTRQLTHPRNLQALPASDRHISSQAISVPTSTTQLRKANQTATTVTSKHHQPHLSSHHHHRSRPHHNPPLH